MRYSNAGVKRRMDIRRLAAVLAVTLVAAVVAAGAAWAAPAGEESFGDVSDVGAQAGVDDEGAQGEADAEKDPVAKKATAGPDADAPGADVPVAPTAEAEGDASQVDGEGVDVFAEKAGFVDATDLPGAFFEDELKVTVGQTFAVGFLPAVADGDSDDEARAKWHGDWKAYVEENGVDLSSESGWLEVKDADDNLYDYDGITGIVTSDADVFELFGEFPDWKVDDATGVEFRWWYGLLGKAKKAGDATLYIAYRQADGTSLIAGKCTVHVIEPKKDVVKAKGDDVKASRAADGSDNGVLDVAGDSGSDDAAANAPKAAESVVETQAVEQTDADGATGSQSSSSSGLSSKSATDSGSGLSSQSAGSKGSDGEGSSTQVSTTADTYPKEIAATVSGAKIAGSLLANDEATANAFQQLEQGNEFCLTVEVKDKLGDAAEQALTSVATTNNVQLAERLAIKVVDASGNEVTLTGMNLTVKIAADDAVKALNASSVQVYYVSDNGQTEKKEAKLDNGLLSFVTDHLSDYAVFGTKSNTSGTSTTGTTGTTGTSTTTTTTGGKTGLPQTGDLMGYLAIVLAFVAGFSASSALNARRRLKDIPIEMGPPIG